jgi:hypothetical protein
MQGAFLQKVIQSLHGSNVLEATAPKTEGFLLKDICTFSTLLYRPI